MFDSAKTLMNGSHENIRACLICTGQDDQDMRYLTHAKNPFHLHKLRQCGVRHVPNAFQGHGRDEGPLRPELGGAADLPSAISRSAPWPCEPQLALGFSRSSVPSKRRGSGRGGAGRAQADRAIIFVAEIAAFPATSVSAVRYRLTAPRKSAESDQLRKFSWPVNTLNRAPESHLCVDLR
jgi:hypothetical protein